jgi:hypothetical protein
MGSVGRCLLTNKKYDKNDQVHAASIIQPTQFRINPGRIMLISKWKIGGTQNKIKTSRDPYLGLDLSTHVKKPCHSGDAGPLRRINTKKV